MIQDSDFIASLKQIELFLRPSKYSKRLGIHHLANHGQSLEFSGYQEYRPGDDLKDLDWKLFARSDRYFVKQKDTQTFASTLILLDDSPSMGFYSSSARISKFQGALLLAFALGYVLYKQGDVFGFQALFTDEISQKPRSSKKAFFNFTHTLEKMNRQGPLGNKEFSNRHYQPKSIDHIFVISDFLAPDGQWKDWFGMINLIAKETSCFHLIDPEEERPHPHAEVRNIENKGEYRYISSGDWKEYRKNFLFHKQKLRRWCLQQNIDYSAMYTDQSIENSIQKQLWSKKLKNGAS
ncbi:MAG: DUF58 domain-containing protein [SAR324 cluster bacterium]|nr:DUF58 domain-containing protein [SAR324 cluster bacterium]